MAATQALVRRHAYVDSITLLQVTSALLDLEGVAAAVVVMATDLNREVLRDASLLVDDAATAGPNDLVIAVRASDDASARAAIERAEVLIGGRRTSSSSSAQDIPPRSLRSAHRAGPEAQLAVISVPGPFAAGEARLALADGLHVFLFSDNVAIEDEIDLKQSSRARGLLVMGPDCGTAILNGVGYGFANVVARGSVGIVGASGTGIQEVTCLLNRSGVGISHAIGTGSRDLHAAVGGITTLQAIDLLRDDPSTDTIVLVSKPSDADVAWRVLEALARTSKRAVAYLQGQRVKPPEGVTLAASLEEAARLSTGVEPHVALAPRVRLDVQQRGVRGLFCGGTLCTEAAALVGDAPPHQFIDFGDDQFTRGRAHPMLDPTLRNQAIVQAGGDPTVGVVLLDVILGLGTHPDPAGAALPAIEQARVAAAAGGRELAVLAHVVGTERDPQNLKQQEATLRSAGVALFDSNYQAARAASLLVEGVAV